jgi:hypothetical protein
VEYENDEIYINLVASKAKIAPIKEDLTIPRMELEAAVLGARMAKPLAQDLEHSSKFSMDRLHECSLVDQMHQQGAQEVRGQQAGYDLEKLRHV